DQDAETTGVEEIPVDARDAVDDAGEADGVIGSPPALAGELQAAHQRAIDVGELVGLAVAVGPAGAREDSEIVGDLLLGIEADAGTAGVLAHRADVSRPAGREGELDGIVEAAHASTREEAGHRDLAVASPQLMAMLDLADPLELAEARVEVGAVRHDRQIEQTAAHRPRAVIPLGGCSVG